MRQARGPAKFCNNTRVTTPGAIIPFRNMLGRPVPPWYSRSYSVCSSIFGRPLLNHQPHLNLVPQNPLVTTHPLHPHHHHSYRKRKQTFVRSRFRHRKRRNSGEYKITFNPNDPLNLQDLMKETERRRVAGLSPLRGDSRMNTPAVSAATDVGEESPSCASLSSVSKIPSSSYANLSSVMTSHRNIPALSKYRSSHGNKRFPLRYRSRSFVRPITGNYSNYYFRRDPGDRLPYLMPEWFVGKDVADYGCHNGTLTFGVLERFPEVRKIDAFDCDAELIANAQSMQRERLRWNTGSNVRYDKISFQVANWIDNSSNIDEPEYDTIMAFSVTKWIHLNHGDAGLMRFFRRAFNLLKPGGHLILEPQPKSSYRKTRFASCHRSLKSLKIDPSKLEPLLVDLGFSYFDTIKEALPHQPFRRKIILCSKSYGATPASIRNDLRSEIAHWEDCLNSPSSPRLREPPPVCYHPQTPVYVMGTPISLNCSPAVFVSNPSISNPVLERSPGTHDNSVTQYEPDSTSIS